MPVHSNDMEDAIKLWAKMTGDPNTGDALKELSQQMMAAFGRNLDGEIMKALMPDDYSVLEYTPVGELPGNKEVRYSSESEWMPCPFCGCMSDPVAEGWKPVSGPSRGIPRGFYLLCDGCGINIGKDYDRDGDVEGIYETRDKALEFWNNRVTILKQCEL